jgi:hypothetical protein
MLNLFQEVVNLVQEVVNVFLWNTQEVLQGGLNSFSRNMQQEICARALPHTLLL